MGSTVEIAITAEQGQYLLQYMGQFEPPAQLGTKVYTAIEKTSMQMDVLECYEALMDASPFLQRRGEPGVPRVFGPEDNWTIQLQENSIDVKSASMQENGLKVPVTFSRRALNGATWIMLFACHPESKLPRAPIHVQHDVIYPLAVLIKRKGVLATELGVGMAKMMDWADDEVAVA